jgi:hypothetical protein
MPVLSNAIDSKGSTPGIVLTLRREWVCGLLSQVKALRKSRRSRIQPTTIIAMPPLDEPVFMVQGIEERTAQCRRSFSIERIAAERLASALRRAHPQI